MCGAKKENNIKNTFINAVDHILGKIGTDNLGVRESLYEVRREIEGQSFDKIDNEIRVANTRIKTYLNQIDGDISAKSFGVAKIRIESLKKALSERAAFTSSTSSGLFSTKADFKELKKMEKIQKKNGYVSDAPIKAKELYSAEDIRRMMIYLAQDEFNKYDTLVRADEGRELNIAEKADFETYKIKRQRAQEKLEAIKDENLRTDTIFAMRAFNEETLERISKREISDEAFSAIINEHNKIKADIKRSNDLSEKARAGYLNGDLSERFAEKAGSVVSVDNSSKTYTQIGQSATGGELSSDEIKVKDFSSGELMNIKSKIDASLKQLDDIIDQKQKEKIEASRAGQRAHERLSEPGYDHDRLRMEMIAANATIDTANRIISDCKAKASALHKNKSIIDRVITEKISPDLSELNDIRGLVVRYASDIEKVKGNIDDTDTNYAVMNGVALEADDTFAEIKVAEEDMTRYDEMVEKMKKILNGME